MEKSGAMEDPTIDELIDPDPNDSRVCHECLKSQESTLNRLIVCDWCNEVVHQRCYKPEPLPEPRKLPMVWTCDWCKQDRPGGPREAREALHNCRAFLTESAEKCSLCSQRVYGLCREGEHDNVLVFRAAEQAPLVQEPVTQKDKTSLSITEEAALKEAAIRAADARRRGDK